MPDPFDIYLSSPVVAHGVVYFGSSDSYVYALDAGTGALRWMFQTGDVVHASPALADGTVYIGSWDSWFYALDAATGALRWRFQTGEDPDIHNQVGLSSSALVAGGTVYVGCRDGHLYALDARTGTSRWSFDTHRAWVTSSPVLSGASVYFGAGSSYKFFGVDTATGRATLELTFRRGIFSSPIVNGGTLYTADFGGTLTAVDLATGKVVGRFRTDASRRAEVAYLAAARRAAADTGSADPSSTTTWSRGSISPSAMLSWRRPWWSEACSSWRARTAACTPCTEGWGAGPEQHYRRGRRGRRGCRDASATSASSAVNRLLRLLVLSPTAIGVAVRDGRERDHDPSQPGYPKWSGGKRTDSGYRPAAISVARATNRGSRPTV